MTVLTGGSWWQGVRGEREGGVGWLPGLTRLELGPGMAQVGLATSSLFFVLVFILFCFSLFFYIFSKLISNKVKPKAEVF
jgi:hypothetical protein